MPLYIVIYCPEVICLSIPITVNEIDKNKAQSHCNESSKKKIKEKKKVIVKKCDV